MTAPNDTPPALVGEGHPSWGAASAATTAAPLVVLGYAAIAAVLHAVGGGRLVIPGVAAIVVTIAVSVAQLARLRWARWAFPILGGLGVLVALGALAPGPLRTLLVGDSQELALLFVLVMLGAPTNAATKLSFRIPVPAADAARLSPRPDAARLALAMPALSTAVICLGAALVTGSAFDMLKPFHVALALAAFAFALSGLRLPGTTRWKALGVATLALLLTAAVVVVEHRAAGR